MADFSKLFPFILKMEGGFVNDPCDAGGATNKGITLATLKTWRSLKQKPVPTIADLLQLTNNEAREIYKANFWDKCKGDEIKSQKLANIIVDWRINSGLTGVKKVQELLKTTPDGIFGKNTLALLNAQDENLFFERVYNARVAFYNNLVAKKPSQKKFLKGWLNRLKIVKSIS